MADTVKLEQLVLGPRAAGRDFGVVAATPTLTLSDEALSATLDFNLALGNHVRIAREIRAFFPISAPPARVLWFLSTTSYHGKIAGNPIWMTWGQVIDADQLRAIDGCAHRLLQFHEPHELPEAGRSLCPLIVDIAKLRQETATPGLDPSTKWRLQPSLGQTPLVIDVEAPMDATATLVSILDDAEAATRFKVSFVTAPIALRHWNLICFQREDWKSKDVWQPARAKVHSVNGAGVVQGDPVDVADVLWWKLRSAVAACAGADQVPGLRQALLDECPGADAAQLVEQRLSAGLGAVLSGIRAQSGEAAALAAMAGLMDAIAEIGDDEPRSLLSAALRKVYGELVRSRPEDAAWVELYFRRSDRVRERLFWPPLMLARLAAAGKAASALDPVILGQLAPEMVSTFAGMLLEQANSALLGRLISEVELLAETLEYYGKKKSSDAMEAAWELVYAYHRRVVQASEKEMADSPDSAGSQKARTELTRFLFELNNMGNGTQLDRFLKTDTAAKAANVIGGLSLQRIIESREQVVADALARDRLAKREPTNDGSAWPFAFLALDARTIGL